MRYIDENGNEVESLGNDHKHGAIVKGLRELASFIEKNPPLTPYSVSVSEYLYPETFKAVIRQFGSCDKEPWGDSFQVTKKFGDGLVTYRLSTSREDVCTKKVIGTETVEVTDFEAVRALPKKRVEREVVEWECDPILK